MTTASAPDGDAVAGVRLGGGAPMALIDGQWWRLGGQPRGARLASITLQGAWLHHSDGRRQFLPLLPPPPAIVLSPRAAPPAARTPAAAPPLPATKSARP
ncbi:MAG: hypothetical protein JNJ89_01615 [Rubrivivax sp.]|nr:hypothetical protein [Rubrivivax sp.]